MACWCALWRRTNLQKNHLIKKQRLPALRTTCVRGGESYSVYKVCISSTLFSYLKLVNGMQHHVAEERFRATELAGAGTYVAAFGRLLAEQVNGF